MKRIQFIFISALTFYCSKAQFPPIHSEDHLWPDSNGLVEIINGLNVPTITVLLLQRRFKGIYGQFLRQINENRQQSITFDDREKFLLWVEESQKLSFSTTTLIFGKPKDLIEEVH